MGLDLQFSLVEQERIECSILAAHKYGIPPNIMLAVAEQEGGRPGQWIRNKNGTYDIGSMQFNTSYLSDLARYGITAEDVSQAGCYPFELAAWRIRQHIQNDSGSLWQRVANYHSRTPSKNIKYRSNIEQRARRWDKWLETNAIDTVSAAQHGNKAKSSTSKPRISNKKYVSRTISFR